ncbi:conserved hypothetical protein [Gammaproteobacteria bacterium]
MMSRSDQPRILLILETYLPDIGGAEFHLYYLAKQLLARGYAVEIVTGCTDLKPDHQDICPVHRYPHAVGRRALPYALVWLFRFIRMFRQFDIIHVHHSSFLATIAVIAGRITGRPVVVSLHGLGAHHSAVGRCPIRRFYRYLSLRGATRIIATSEELQAVAWRFAPAERVFFIPNGVDTKTFTPRQPRSFDHIGKELRLLTLRRLTLKHGVQFVIQALAAAGNRLAFTLRIAGDGPLRDTLERAVASHGLDDRVHFEGFLSHRQIIPVLEGCDVALFLSTVESTSLAALECMAMGCLVVCSNAGAYPRFIKHGVTGFMVDLFEDSTSRHDAPESLDPSQVVRIVDTLVAIQHMAPTDLAKVVEQARGVVRECFDWSVITERTLTEAYLPLLTQKVIDC